MNDFYLEDRDAEAFDFYRVRERIASLAASEDGRALILARMPTRDAARIQELKALAAEWGAYLSAGLPQALSAFPATGEITARLAIPGAALSQEELFALGLFARSARRTRSLIIAASKSLSLPRLSSAARGMPDLSGAEDEIFSVLDAATGEVRDLPALRALRERISRLAREAESALARLLKDPALRASFRSDVPVLRDGRQLLAVRADRIADVRGVVYAASDSGRTLFVEPEESVLANNLLIKAESEYKASLAAIFRRLSDALRPASPAFDGTRCSLSLLDSALAAERYRQSVHGVFPGTSGDSAFRLLRARHPQLARFSVPVTIEIPPSKRALIITGPNAGGKTLALKTAALFVMLNQSGFPVGADGGTAFPLFDGIMCDMGDSQSLAAGLSTFSGSMQNTARALRESTEKSLVLWDEAGSGTDPDEGGAIACAVLDALLRRGALVIVTTHLSSLKNFGFIDPRCLNASVGFDGGPTYRLSMGGPGESHAMEIAREAGIPQEVIDKAGSFISGDRANVSRIIASLTEKSDTLDDMIQKQAEKGEELRARELKLREREVKLLERDAEVRERERSQDSAFVRDARSRLENLVRTLREGEITREKTAQVKGFIRDLDEGAAREGREAEDVRAALSAAKDALEEESRTAENGMRLSRLAPSPRSSKRARSRPSNAEALKSARPIELSAEGIPARAGTRRAAPVLEEGGRARLSPEGAECVLLRRERDGVWLVLLGSVRISVPESRLTPLSPAKSPAGSPSIVFEKDAGGGEDAPVHELRLLGMRSADALKALERQLDLCVLSGLKSFSVIHGKGDGVLRQAVHDLLNHWRGVKDFYYARPEDGGFGKTYVELY